MSFLFTFAGPRLGGRVLGVAVLLLALSAADLCSAAEKTFSDTYSVQLPAAWTGDLQKDKSLMGAGPGGVTFGFKAYPSDISPAEYVEKALANTEKRPGYKLIEKTAVKTSPDSKALRIRYQTDGPKGPESMVKFYFQLVDKEVVILLFQLPNFSSTSAKNDIEAIFNSVKLTTAAGQEDSWATPSPDKSKETSKTTGADYSEIAGKYVSSKQSSDYIILKADGTFSYQITGESGTSTYTRSGATITLKFGDDPDDAELEKDALVDSSGKRWVRKAESASEPQAPPKKSDTVKPADGGAKWPCAVDAETRSAVAKAKLAPATTIPGTNASIRFPAGWTEEVVKSSNKTLIVFNNADQTSRIAVYGRTSTTLVQLVNNYKKKANTEFVPGDVCEYKLGGVPAATAIRFEVRGPGADDLETHAVSSFAPPGSQSGEITLIDCHTSGQMDPNDAALFEASLQSLKFSSANSR